MVRTLTASSTFLTITLAYFSFPNMTRCAIDNKTMHLKVTLIYIINLFAKQTSEWNTPSVSSYLYTWQNRVKAVNLEYERVNIEYVWIPKK